MRKKIVWTLREEEIILARGQQLHREHPEWDPWRCLAQGQNQLPEDRRRPVTSSTRYLPRTQQMLKRIAVPSAVATPPPAPAPVHVPIPVASAIEEMCEAVADRIAETVGARLRAQLRIQVAAVVQTAVNVASAAKAQQKRRRVLVVGPLDGQARQLEAEFKDLLEVRVFAKERNPADIGVAATTCDWVVLWADFISHKHSEATPKEKAVTVHGGMDALRAKLEEIYCA
jgi:hypothetical protein